MPSHSSRPILVLLLALLVVLSAHATFLFNDTTGVDALVDFNQFTAGGPGQQLTATPVVVLQDGDLTVTMASPSYAAPGADNVNYGVSEFRSGNFMPSGDYIVQMKGQTSISNALEFQFAGGAVTTVGLKISATTFPNPALTPILFQAFDANDNVVATFELTPTSSPANSADLATWGNPDNPDADFMGLSAPSAQIVRFRVTGGKLTFDDLQFGGVVLDSASGGEDPGPGGSSAVPEPSTYLLCGSALAMLLAGLRGRQRKTN